MPRRFLAPRLLPIVIAVGTPLLVLKGAGLIHAADAQEATATSRAAASATPAGSNANDPAADDLPATSRGEVDVLTSLAKRRAALDSRAQSLAMRENLLAATEQRVDAKIALLKQLQGQIQQLLAQRDTAQEKQITALVKTYSSMKPKDAARIFNSLDDAVLLAVAEEMKPDVLAPVLAAMQADKAQKLTVDLADRLRVPAPQLPAAAPVPQAAPQTAAAAPIDPSTLSAALAPETSPGAQPEALTTPAQAQPPANAVVPADSKAAPAPTQAATAPAPTAAGGGAHGG